MSSEHTEKHDMTNSITTDGSSSDQMGAPYERPGDLHKIESVMNSSEYVSLPKRLASASHAERLSVSMSNGPLGFDSKFSMKSVKSMQSGWGGGACLPEVTVGKQMSIASVASSSCCWKDEEQTMIVVDWDDTLFPTTWLKQREWFRAWLKNREGVEAMSRVDQLTLSEFDQVARDFFLEAAAHGKVCCVTLAQRPWQTWTMQAFLPRLYEVWERNAVDVRYAGEEVSAEVGSRSNSRQVPGLETNELDNDRKHSKQKKKAMQGLIKKFYMSGSWKNVVSIGDGPAEREALKEIGFTHRNPRSLKSGMQKVFRVKTVQMVQDPTCEQLRAQLQVLTSWLASLVFLDDDFDVDFNTSEEDLLNLQERLGDLLESDQRARSPPVSP